MKRRCMKVFNNIILRVRTENFLDQDKLYLKISQI